MIPSFEGWQFYELVTDDGGGVITEWLNSQVDEEELAIVDALLLSYRQNQQWDDLWESKFDGFDSIMQIPVVYLGGKFKIFGTRGNSIYEFIMLLIARGKPTKRISQENRQIIEERITLLRTHPRQYREFGID